MKTKHLCESRPTNYHSYMNTNHRHGFGIYEEKMLLYLLSIKTLILKSKDYGLGLSRLLIATMSPSFFLATIYSFLHFLYNVLD